MLNDNLVAAFLALYMPSGVDRVTDPACTWLHETISVAQSDSALSASLKALSMNRVGWANNDKALMMQGRMVYNQALRQLQLALYDEDAMHRDETLAAARTLMTYDVSLPAFGPVP
jgi:hypothetical protein